MDREMVGELLETALRELDADGGHPEIAQGLKAVLAKIEALSPEQDPEPIEDELEDEIPVDDEE